MKFNVLLSVVLTTLIQTNVALNILAIFPYQGKSHFMVYRVHIRELAKRGHNVTVISHFPEEDPPKNYQDISLAGSIPIIQDNDDVPMERSYFSIFITVHSYLLKSGVENCEVMLANKDVQNLIRSKPKFDVVLTEAFNSDCSLGVAYKIGAPVITTLSSIFMPWHYDRHGVPYNPAYVPFHFLEGGTKPTLYQRIERTVMHFICKNLYYYVSQRADQRTLAKYFDDIPPLEELAREVKFSLQYHNFILTGSRLFPANVIEIGGYHVANAKPLTGDLKSFIDEAEHGVVYISFGSVVKSTNIAPEKVKDILEAMNEFPQRFIWKWEDSSLQFDKKKLFVSSWLPQVDILGSPKVLAFISHAGMGGTTEGIHYGVPMIAMPILGDQPSNAAAIEESGLGIQLHYRDLTKENLVAALKKVLEPRFKENAKKVSQAWHDRPLSPLDTAVFWTEYTARHSNFTFRTAAADVPLYQYINLDVIAVVLATAVAFFAIVKTVCSSKSKPQKKKSKRD